MNEKISDTTKALAARVDREVVADRAGGPGPVEYPHPSRVTASGPDYVTGLLPKCPECPLAEGHDGDHLEDELQRHADEVYKGDRAQDVNEDRCAAKGGPMTRRERLEKKRERRLDWAESADKRSDAAMDAEHAIGDRIPFGQPILVGHHSEGRARRDQARMQSLATKSVEESKKAEHHRGAADGIERALATSIFSDDDDAVEALRAKVERLEGERDRMKAENDEFRRAHKAELAAMTPYERSQAIPYASYSLSNLGARIRDAKQRAARLERENELREKGVRAGGRVMVSRYPGECPDCGQPIARGDSITWYRITREAVHVKCPTEEVDDGRE